jgi:CheY-like chemotaxis protein
MEEYRLYNASSLNQDGQPSERAASWMRTGQDGGSAGEAAFGKLVRRILVVDDEEVVRKAIKLVLSSAHHLVETANSGKEALSSFRPGKFDLVITDYELPGMKGDELAAAIKAQAPEQPILMLTAYGEQLRASGGFPLAVDSLLAKPFDIQALQSEVLRLTEQEASSA